MRCSVGRGSRKADTGTPTAAIPNAETSGHRKIGREMRTGGTRACGTEIVAAETAGKIAAEAFLA